MSRGDRRVKRDIIALALGAAMLSPLGAAADAGFGGEGTTAAYLIAKTAERHSAYARATAAWQVVLDGSGYSETVAESAISNAVNAGNMRAAIALAQEFSERGHRSQIASLALVVGMAEREAWAEISAALEGGLSVGPLVNGLAEGWAAIGAGQRAKAEAAFDAVAATPGLTTFGLMHKAYALGAIGDDVAAEAIWASGNHGKPLRLSRNSAFARISGLARSGRTGAAIAVLDKLFDPADDPEAALLRAAIVAGTPPAPTIGDAKAGIAETFLAVAAALKGEATDGYTLLYTRAATHLVPDHPGALILQAQLLGGLKLHDEALAVWRQVPEGGSWITARLGAAEELIGLGRQDEAIGLLSQLAATRAATGSVHLALGDALRASGRLDEAVTAYDSAVAAADPDEVPWRTFFARGIALDRAGHWDEAKADLRRALDAAPEEPNILNYLGYAMAKRGEALSEALHLVETAAAAKPDSGRIADNVGWVLHRMGLHEKAVGHLEKAVSLLPGDAAANEHLGDGYWAVGREREARFQWRRALAFTNLPEDTARIRAKLLEGPAPAKVEEARSAEAETSSELAATIGN